MPATSESEYETTVALTAAERRLLRNALQTYLSDFGHEDHDLIVATRRVLAKLTEADTAATTALRASEATG